MLEVGRMANVQEDRTHFGAWVITSSPLILGYDLNDESITDRVWDIITNTEALAISQVWDGHPGRLAKSWNPASGNSSTEFVWGVPCISTDASQQGWAYDSKSQHLTAGKGKYCVAPHQLDNMIAVVPCDSADQNQKWAPNSKGEMVHIATRKCLDVYDFHGPVVQVYACNGGSNQQFSIQGSSVKAGSGQCLAIRHGEPESTSGFQLWVKPVGNGAVAALVINAYSDKSMPVDIYLSDLGIPAGSTVNVRAIWDKKDLATASTSFQTDTIGPHDSRLYRISPVKAPLLN